ncbi:MAG: hypothetical protein KAF27_10590 [Porphyrobacter sp.]|nr:hypothetical protein [Porphyrobacter sp.]
MEWGKQANSGKRRRKHKGRKQAPPRQAPKSLAGHRAFAPLLGLWGALLGGLVVAVLPPATVDAALDGTLMGTWGDGAQAFIAGLAAVVIGVPVFALAAMRHNKAQRSAGRQTIFDHAVRQRVTPINPARDLGTRSLDDPIEAMPFTTPAWRDADLDTAPATAPAWEAPAAPQPAAEPVELDLAAFAELPTRNAVWVGEEIVAAPEPEPEPTPAPESDPAASRADPVADIRARRLRAVAVPPPPVPGAAALARLRAVPTEDLSLAEMVERFAGALHEHRETPPVRSLNSGDLAAREAALAEALKALAALSGGAPAAPVRPSRDEPLRAALAQLQPQRGAA